MTAVMTLRRVAPAKINLYLHVLGRRRDGYHELESLVAFAGIADRLTFMPGNEWRLAIEGPFAEKLEGAGGNLILAAARAYAAAAEDVQGGTFILEKNLPVASGIGGGSADAAAALMLLDEANGGRGRHLLAGLAERLGSDVPVCLAGKASLMLGRGETVMPVTLPSMPAVLANPGIHVPTAAVFAELAAPALRVMTTSSPVVPGDADGLIAFLAAGRNDLEAPAIRLHPAIATCIDALRATSGCRLARMSGSGASVFALYSSAGQAEEAAAAIMRDHPDWWVCSTNLG